MDFLIKRGDTRPELVATLSDSNGAAINLAACTVTMNARSHRSGLSIQRVCVVVGPSADGKVSYSFVDGDWDEGEFRTGLYDVEFEIVGAGWRLTVPSEGFKSMEVAEDLA